MDIVLLKRMQYGGKSCSPGDRVSARSKDAKALVYLGKAIYAPVDRAGELAESLLALDEALDETLGVLQEPTVVEQDEEKPKRKYTYKRRDMTAEKPG